MLQSIAALSATEELAIAHIESQMSDLRSKGFVPNGNISITKQRVPFPGDVSWVKAELPITKA